MSGSPESKILVLTIGHSDMAVEYFVGLLEYRHVKHLVDVRSEPYSKIADWATKKNLARVLAKDDIEYHYLGDKLGGKPADPEVWKGEKVDWELLRKKEYFVWGIEDLILIAARAQTAIMCSEENPQFCHRSLAVAPSLEARGVEVAHIRHNGSLQSESSLRPQIKLPLF